MSENSSGSFFQRTPEFIDAQRTGLSSLKQSQRTRTEKHLPLGERPCSEIILQTANNLVRGNGCVMSLHNRDGRYLGQLISIGVDRRAAVVIAGRTEAHDADTLYKVSAPDWRVAIMRVPVSPCASASASAGLGGAHVLQVSLGNNTGNNWLLSLVRNHPATPFTEADMEALKTVVPMFEWLLSRDVPSPVLECGAAGWQILDQFRMGVVLLGSDGRLAAANRKALELFRRSFGLMLSKGRLTLARPSDNQRFQNALRERKLEHSGHVLAVDSEDGAAMLQIRVLHLGASAQGEGDRSQVAVLLSDLVSFEQPDPAPLRDIYGLTEIEAQMVCLIFDGLSPSQAAQRLNITTNTARGYLKSVFRKMGVHRQTDLIRLVAVCPSHICK